MEGLFQQNEIKITEVVIYPLREFAGAHKLRRAFKDSDRVFNEIERLQVDGSAPRTVLLKDQGAVGLLVRLKIPIEGIGKQLPAKVDEIASGI